jgi:arsenate reductase (thioredoxin)
VSEKVVFVCLHGAARSRMAAAYFNRIAPPGWTAVSAGLEPDAMLSPTAARLLAGTEGEAYLDQSPPRSIAEIGAVNRVVGIDCRPEGSTDHWQLHNQDFDEGMRDEIRARAEALAAELGDGP